MGADVERQLDLVVAAEIVAQADEHRALQHVGAAIGSPGVADAVGAGADRDAALDAAASPAAPGAIAGPVVMIATSASASASISGSTRSRSGAPRQNAWLIVTLPCMPSAARALDDQLHREGAHLARLVQVDVDRPAVASAPARTPGRDGPWDRGRWRRDRGRRPPRRPSPAPRSISSTRAGTHQHAGLREGDDLEVDRRRDSARASPSRPRCRQRPTSVSTSTWLRIWVVPCASDSTIWRADCRAGSMPSALLQRALVVDLVDQPRADLVLVPAHAPQRLVEMGVRLDQARRARWRRRRRSTVGAGRSRRRSTRCARRRCRIVGERPGHRADIGDQ